MSSPTIAKYPTVQSGQERHLEQWVTARRGEKARQFALWTLGTIAVELAILAPVWWYVGR